MVSRQHPLNMAVQAGKIRSLFPDSKISCTSTKLTWTHTITPSPLSESYEVRLIYVQGEHPNVYVIRPEKLMLYKSATKLPHVYDTEKQKLCLYYRKAREWNSELFIADTIIPWASEWLYHYEFWLGDGNWRGGGIHHETEAEKQANKQKEETNETISDKKK